MRPLRLPSERYYAVSGIPGQPGSLNRAEGCPQCGRDHPLTRPCPWWATPLVEPVLAPRCERCGYRHGKRSKCIVPRVLAQGDSGVDGVNGKSVRSAFTFGSVSKNAAKGTTRSNAARRERAAARRSASERSRRAKEKYAAAVAARAAQSTEGHGDE